SQHESGTARIAEAVAEIKVDLVVNVQGDEPFVKRELLENLLNIFKNDSKEEIKVASLMHQIVNEQIIANPNHVKVVIDKNNDALLFSRSIIPFHRDVNTTPVYYKHIGIYAFRKNILMDFAQWETTPLEEVERLEQLRLLENGIKIKMIRTEESPISIDTPEDLEHARKVI
ncbi:MAG: 3-deoxy-manno-octulosonate cytidylyltransferase, partial [Ginsengibacter sp.]